MSFESMGPCSVPLRLLAASVGLASLGFSSLVAANGIGGCQTVSLQGQNHRHYDIGELRFSNPQGRGELKAEFRLIPGKRPSATIPVVGHSSRAGGQAWQCFEIGEQAFCHLSILHDSPLTTPEAAHTNARKVTQEDLLGLEVQLVFLPLASQRAEVDWRNAGYFRVSWDAWMGSTLQGQPHALNLNWLAETVPEEQATELDEYLENQQELRIVESDIQEAASETHAESDSTSASPKSGSRKIEGNGNGSHSAFLSLQLKTRKGC